MHDETTMIMATMKIKMHMTLAIMMTTELYMAMTMTINIFRDNGDDDQDAHEDGKDNGD